MIWRPSIVARYFESGSHDTALGGLVNEGARAGRFNISVTQFLSTNAWRPNGPEQQKIADCLISADTLIEAQGQRLEALRAHKKGLMQQLFPRSERIESGIKIPAETQPRLRFPEFEGTGEWEEAKLQAACTMQAGSRVVHFRRSKGTVPRRHALLSPRLPQTYLPA
jgi:type I restriction enzyme S subunit